MNPKKLYIYIILALYFLVIPIINVSAQDYSTPLASITTLEKELDKGNFDLYKNFTYYSPDFIAQIPTQFGMTYEDFRLCLDDVLIHNLSLLKYELETDNPQLERIEILKEEKIDATHVHLFYQTYYSGKADPIEDNSYFINTANGWELDIAPEIKNVVQQHSAAEVCPTEFKRAVAMERILNLNVLQSIDPQRAVFDYNGYRVRVGLWDKDFDYLDIGQVGQDDNKIAYQFNINSPMTVRNLDDAAVSPELKKRLDYVTAVAKIIDEKAPGEYNNVGDYLSVDVNDINSNTLSFKTERQYEPDEARFADHPIYKNIKPVEVTINFTDRTVAEKSLIPQEKQADEKYHQLKNQISLNHVLVSLKANWLKLMISFLILWLICFIWLHLLARSFKILPLEKIKILMIAAIISALTTILIALTTAQSFVALFGDQMVSSFGLLGGLLFGNLFIKFLGVLIITIISFVLIKFLLMTSWLRALIISFLTVCLLLLYIYIVMIEYIV